jgi:RNA polymerase sigma-70 factor (ECF subfamily)
MTTMAMAQTPVKVTDEALVAAAQAGDRSAFSMLVGRYRELAFAYAFARLRDRDEAEDMAQEAFVRAYLALDRFRMTGCWSAWMMCILRNLCTDALRRQRFRQVASVDGEWLDDSPSPEAVTLLVEGRRELRAAVAQLPEKYRVPLVMHFGAGRTYREIALALGLRESTVVGRMAGALKRLRRRMGAPAC